MDLVPQAANETPSLVAFDNEHISVLLGELAQLDAAVGQEVPKRRMTGGCVGIEVPRERLLEAARTLRDALGFDMLTCVTAVDMVDHVESIYHFRSLGRNYLLQVRVQLPSDAPEVDSLVSIYASANWLERECYDMVGIRYLGHPDLRRILLDDEFYGHPLLKSFRPTPLTVHDRATTQVDAVRAVAGEQQRNVERVVAKNLGQGEEERLHPGKLTFGSAAVYVKTGQGVEDGSAPVSHQITSENPDQEGPVMKPQRG